MDNVFEVVPGNRRDTSLTAGRAKRNGALWPLSNIPVPNYLPVSLQDRASAF